MQINNDVDESIEITFIQNDSALYIGSKVQFKHT